MAGGYYAALSGLQTRMDALDRLAADIANTGTAGYKTERAGTVQADRPSFGAVLQSAVDVANGPARLNLRPGSIASTHRPLDLAIEGSGFFVVDTPAGPRYTRNGHLVRRADGVLTTDSGDPIQGVSGPIQLGEGPIEVDSDGTVRSITGIVGNIKVVEFPPDVQLIREGSSRFRADGAPRKIDRPSLTPGALEQSNVSIVERVAELSEVSRSYEALLRGVSVLMNDVDKVAISELGRR